MAILNMIGGGGSKIALDHLEGKFLVGELYTANDDLIMQYTPSLSDSTIGQNVGNTADNTQIHIQRIASGTASNKLKLKIKKVGSPGDLTVQVMKGISVTVTADVEAYWYGDSSNTLATGTLFAASVTTSFQELEVTLGNNFGGTRGDLLDIVLSQSSVNASNYYVIACDSTQWSEGLGFVSVNGTTRTRSKLMPYCVSDGFSSRIISKYSGNNLIIENMTIMEGSWASSISGYYTSTTKDLDGLEDFTTLGISGSGRYSSSSTNGHLMIKSKSDDSTLYGPTAIWGAFSGTVNKSFGDGIYFYYEHSNSSSSWLSFTINYKFTGDYTINKGGTDIHTSDPVGGLGDDIIAYV